MIEIIDIILPILSLVISALLTIPVFRLIRKSSHKLALTVGWFMAVYAVAGTAVANLALKYYGLESYSVLNFTLNGGALAGLSSSFMIDVISIYMSIIVIALSAIILIYTVFAINSNERPSERYFAIMLMLTAALLGAVLSGDLLTLFIFWEAAAAGAGFLMLYKKNALTINSTLKYLVMIIIASAFVVFGLSIVYGITGSLNFTDVQQALVTLADKRLLVIAFIFIATGYAIESAIVPFHFWLPDAYTAAPSTSAAFLSALVDQGSYYILIRVLVFIITPAGLNWIFMLAVMAALTMIVGNLFALIQTNVKRLIANICVADVGYNLVAITSYTSLGLVGNLYFFLIGGITTALAFMAVGVMNSHGYKTLEDFSGIGRKMPLVSLALVMAGLSFAGVPPLGGFMAKYLVFTSAIEANMSWLAVIGVLTSVLQTAYLFRLVNYMYARKPKDETVINESKRILIPIFILAAAILILGLFPQIVFNLLQPGGNLQLIPPI
ncbi:MAG: NADH-quinone oxidoreductase subunit N [Candidatus Bathyarchaeota archaeon]|nr:NADH-quinone oxidoreductase subunit N [Candidatus Bathyarchaeota archaeon]